MSIFRHLRLDDIATSSEFENDFAVSSYWVWIILFGSMVVQITVATVPSIYGVVLGNLVSENKTEFNLWSEKITLTPVLMTAFWNISNPWSELVTKLASIPQVVALIGVALLALGMIASGYLASGGVAAFLTSLSAGAIMGIGASFVSVQANNSLKQHFVFRYTFADTLRNTAFGLGLLVIPEFALNLLEIYEFKTGLLTLATIFVPTAVASLFLKSLRRGRPSTSPYRLLISPENETEELQKSTKECQDEENPSISATSTHLGLKNEAYSFDDADDDVNIFVSAPSKDAPLVAWKNYICELQTVEFWAAFLAGASSKSANLFLCLLLPPVAISRIPLMHSYEGASLLTVMGLGVFVSCIALHCCTTNSAKYQSFVFGCSNWIGGIVMIGISFCASYSWFAVFALLAGCGIGGVLSSQDAALRDTFGPQAIVRTRKTSSTLIGITILLLLFLRSPSHCFQFIGSFQLIGGFFWIAKPVISSLRTRWSR